jgi:hypothetical protein
MQRTEVVPVVNQVEATSAGVSCARIAAQVPSMSKQAHRLSRISAFDVCRSRLLRTPRCVCSKRMGYALVRNGGEISICQPADYWVCCGTSLGHDDVVTARYHVHARTGVAECGIC